MAALVILIVLMVLYLLAIRTNRGRRESFKPFEDTFIAHRGLHTDPDVPENSIPAFQRAVRAGYAIELDVQLTSDDRLVVFHDETLERICGCTRKLHEMTWAELREHRLFGTKHRIPLLQDVLELIDGQVPLVVEIKSEGRYLRTTELTCAMLQKYPGTYCVESFHPLVLRWFRKNSPDTLRGQLATDFRREKVVMPWWQRFLLKNLCMDFLSRPDFIAYDRQYKGHLSFRICRSIFKPVCFSWTVRSQKMLDEDRMIYHAFIFENFTPDDEHN